MNQKLKEMQQPHPRQCFMVCLHGDENREFMVQNGVVLLCTCSVTLSPSWRTPPHIIYWTVISYNKGCRNFGLTCVCSYACFLCSFTSFLTLFMHASHSIRPWNLVGNWFKSAHYCH
jgi:hypothetical protein